RAIFGTPIDGAASPLLVRAPYGQRLSPPLGDQRSVAISGYTGNGNTAGYWLAWEVVTTAGATVPDKVIVLRIGLDGGTTTAAQPIAAAAARPEVSCLGATCLVAWEDQSSTTG